MITTMTSREFNQDTAKAKRAAEAGPVFITDRGRTAHVLMTFEEYEKGGKKFMSAFESLAMKGGEDIEFDPPRSRELPRDIDLS
jgi:hypothetical protein